MNNQWSEKFYRDMSKLRIVFCYFPQNPDQGSQGSPKPRIIK